MVVNGLTNRARYDGSVAFMVVAEAGFNTTARLDGQARTVGVQELQAGDNVIALEVPQASATSSELVMDLELVASGAV